jgi:hypothetical protein
MGCSLDGHTMPCDLVMKHAKFASAVQIYRSVGMRMPNIVNTWMPDDSKDKYVPDLENATGNYYIGDGGHFDVQMDMSNSVQVLKLLPITQIRPQTLQEVMREAAADAASQKLIDSEDCQKFMKNLINGTIGSFALSYSAATEVSAWYGLNAYSQAALKGVISASGQSGRDGNQVTWGVTKNHFEPNAVLPSSTTLKWNDEFYRLSTADAALQILHESLHLIPGFTDFAVARAAAKLANNPNREFRTQDDASRYINEQISEHCGGQTP